MSEFKLIAKSGLGLDRPLEEEWPGFSLSEIEGLGIWWLSAPADGVEALDKACTRQFGAGLPEQGRFTQASGKGQPLRILWAGERQWFVTGDLERMPAAIDKAAWATDQSDGWVAVRIAGENSRAVMEKLCGLDLHPSVFPANTSARAPIEGMHAVVACEDAEAQSYVLFFQRSSARSFLDHVRHAAHSTCPRG